MDNLPRFSIPAPGSFLDPNARYAVRTDAWYAILCLRMTPERYE